MKILAKQIAAALETDPHYAVYSEELNRVWPKNGKRQRKIEKFASDHGWRLRHYKDGFVAIFDKKPPIV